MDKVSTSKQFFKGTVVLILLVLCGFGVAFLANRIANDNNLDLYVVKADSIEKSRIPDTVFVYPNYKKTYTKKRFKTLSINLNKADTGQLKKVYGIGAVFANRIVEYRSKLGGFVNLEQLKEIKGIDQEKFSQIYTNFFIDTVCIQKINLNFAPEFDLANHPYFSRSMVKRILKYRQKTVKSLDNKSKGGIFNLQELIENDILFPYEARKIAPYVTF